MECCSSCIWGRITHPPPPGPGLESGYVSIYLRMHVRTCECVYASPVVDKMHRDIVEAPQKGPQQSSTLTLQEHATILSAPLVSMIVVMSMTMMRMMRGIPLRRCVTSEGRSRLLTTITSITSLTTHTAQYPLSKEHTLNYRGLNIMI